tara:strand:- start:80 stop:433 length:354 start_codon:yes stop_codon:yes gene_type:complete
MMIKKEICSDIASIAIESSGTVFTISNDIGSDGGFFVTIHTKKETVKDLNFDTFKFKDLLYVANEARICWSDCFNPLDEEFIKSFYGKIDQEPFVATLDRGKWAVYCDGGDWIFIKE